MYKTVELMMEYVSKGAEAAAKQADMVRQAVSTFASNAKNAGVSVGASSAEMTAAVAGFASKSKASMSEVESATTKLKDTHKSNMNTMMNDTQVASAIIVGAFGKITTDLIKSTASFEQLGFAAKYLTGTADGASKVAKVITELGVNSMWSQEQIGTLFMRLVGQNKDIDKSRSILVTLMDAVAATTGEYTSLEGAVRAYTQQASRANASSQEMNQFINANIPVTRALADAIVNDLNHPLRQYITSASGAGGATKAMASANEAASANLPIYKKRLEAANQSLDDMKKANKQNTAAFKSKEASIMSLNNQISKATASMDKFSSANGSASKSMGASALTVKEVMSQLQSLGDLGVPGELMADSIVAALKRNYGGATQEMMKSFNGQLQELQERSKNAAMGFLGLTSAWTFTKGSIMDLIKNGMMVLNDFLTKNANNINNFGKALADNKPIIVGIAAVLVGLLSAAIAPLLPALWTMITTWGLVGAVIGFIIDKMGGMEAVTKKVGDAWFVLQAKFAPFIPILQGIKDRFNQLAIGMLNKIYELSQGNKPPFPLTWKDAPNLLQGILNGMLSKFGTFFQLVDQKVQAFKNLLVFGKINMGGIEASWDQVLDSMLQRAKNFYNNAKNYLAFGTTNAGNAQATLEQAIGGIVTRIQAAKTAISTFINGIITDLQPLIEPMKKAFSEIWYMITTQLVPAFANFGQAMTNLFTVIAPILQGILMIFGVVFGTILVIVTSVVSGLLMAFTAMLPGIILFISGLVNAFSGFINFIVGVFSLNWSMAWEGIKTLFYGIVQIIIGLITALAGMIEGFVMGVIGFFQWLYNVLVGHSIIPDLVMAILEWFTKLATDALLTITNWITNIISAITELWNKISAEMSNWPGRMAEWGKNMMQSFVNGIKSMAGAVGDAIKGVLDNAKKFLESHSPPIAGPFKDIDVWGQNTGSTWVDSFKQGLSTLSPDVFPNMAGVESTPMTAGLIPSGTAKPESSASTITITFNGDVLVDSQERLDELINKVTQALGRQNELAAYGAGT